MVIMWSVSIILCSQTGSWVFIVRFEFQVCSCILRSHGPRQFQVFKVDSDLRTLVFLCNLCMNCATCLSNVCMHIKYYVLSRMVVLHAFVSASRKLMERDSVIFIYPMGK